MKRLLATMLMVTGLVAGSLPGAAPAAADSFGWDSGTRCLYQNGHFSIVKIQWRYKLDGGVYIYNPYAVHVLESDGAHHQTVNAATMTVVVDGVLLPTQRDNWSGNSTYTFGPTRLLNARAYIDRSRIQLRTELYSPAPGQYCTTYNRP